MPGPCRSTWTSRSAEATLTGRPRSSGAVNTLEGGFFLDPTAKTDEAVRSVIATAMPNMTTSQLDELAHEMYTSVFDGSQGYADQGSRQMSINGDTYFYCNSLAVNEAYNGAAHAYEFAVTPGVHTQDIACTFDDPYSPSALAWARKTLSSLGHNQLYRLRLP
ncbi:hypothetical protein LEL_04991 [Akanthomyces lecanii RCEF 1005]|uniref:Uncharacterized protein n=1 Tax=Akanthomyces lecanii RCEF 1005 TaxID=1081108 RepID=A0A162KQ05_CORDF|nr:hypothetical protein LEL_04991 [Akanthomyces lecanii RCEF 1005]